MQKETAQAAIAFLQRCDLKGVEAPTLVQVLRELDEIVRGGPPPVETVNNGS